ncbi:MAG: thioredoxin domain-containing protein [Actinomycetota bacterium]
MSETAQANRLIHETSPYLLQHAYNPVDWYPWGEEALARSRAQDRPILLSIGYAACHWCHVMERESFEDPQTAVFMNEHFICIKVDREERPDLDSIYMDAVQTLAGQGGWPMTMFLTPEGAPFFGGTYFPPLDRHGLPSFRRVLEGVVRAWTEQREEITRQGALVVERLKAIAASVRPSDEPLVQGLIGGAVSSLWSNFDRDMGGFGNAPKFPQPPTLELLLRAAADGSERAGEMVNLTLRRMALGGIYDQVGGGFHRYSVDRAWLVPHFEKMLYDNAQLARLYTHAWQAWKTPLYRRVAQETLEYLLRDMRSVEGGFYSSEDADSEGEEGTFYLWSLDEISKVAPEAIDHYRVSARGNFESRNILTAAGDEPADEARSALLAARSARTRPERDDKILTSWNGLALTALAEAGAALGRPDWVEAACQGGAFILDHLVDARGRLLHSYKDGQARVLGMLEDYAYLAEALFTLWEVTFEPRWIEECARLCDQMVELFWDPTDGGFFSTGSDHERLILRPKEIFESVVPSPNALASLVLQKLAILSGNRDHAARGVKILAVARPFMERAPQATSVFLAVFLACAVTD